MIAVNNLLQFVAMYCLVLFLPCQRRGLAANEVNRQVFMHQSCCVLLVLVGIALMSRLQKNVQDERIYIVLFVYSQGVLIALLVYFDVISSIFDTDNSDDIRNISSKLQDFLICIEMFLAAVAHHYSFSYKPFVNLAQGQAWWDAFRYIEQLIMNTIL